MSKNTFEIFGQSHTRFIGMTFYNAKIGTKINLDTIYQELINRQGLEEINTSRREIEKISFLSGVENNIIVAKKISFVLENKNYRVRDYEFGVVRPSHADLVGYQVDKFAYAYQGGGAFSGRLTALYVVLGQLCLQMSTELDYQVIGQIKQVGMFKDDSIIDLQPNLDQLDPCFPVINAKIKTQMLEFLKQVKNNGDSHGAKLAFKISGLPVGIGGMYQNSFESILSKNIYAIGGIKGISFGLGEEYIYSKGSQANDQYYLDEQVIKSDTNNQGGINGGFTNGVQDVYFELIVRPTPTIFKTQKTVRLTQNGWEEYQYKAKGRHDAFIANRIQVVAKNMIYVSIYQMLN